MPNEALTKGRTIPESLVDIRLTTQYSDYSSCFQTAKRDFNKAGELWIEHQWKTLPFLQFFALPSKVKEHTIKDVMKFDDRIRSDYVDILAPYLASTIATVYWSEGDENIQNLKIDAVSKFIDSHSQNPDRITKRLVGMNKFLLAGEIFRMRELMEYKKGKKPPVVILEDKMTNMVKFMVNTLGVSWENFTEDSLDRDTFDFDQYLEKWLAVLRENPSFFDNYRFLYISPDKPVNGGHEILSKSQLREERIRRWIDESNRVLNPTADSTKKDHFFHIDEIKKNGNIMTTVISPDSIVLTDVDGVLTSQQKILGTRQEALKAAFNQIIPDIYQQFFLIGIGQLLKIVSAPPYNLKAGVWLINENPEPVWIKKQLYELSSESVGLRAIIKLESVDDPSGVGLLRLRFIRDDHIPPLDYSFYFNPKKVQQAFANILGYELPVST